MMRKILPDYIEEFWNKILGNNSRHTQVHFSEHNKPVNLKESEDKTRIQSIHSSKGTGRKICIVIDISEKSLKYYNSGPNKLVFESLIYVAFTRAKQMMYVYGDKNDMISNRFGIKSNKLCEITNQIPFTILQDCVRYLFKIYDGDGKSDNEKIQEYCTGEFKNLINECQVWLESEEEKNKLIIKEQRKNDIFPQTIDYTDHYYRAQVFTEVIIILKIRTENNIPEKRQKQITPIIETIKKMKCIVCDTKAEFDKTWKNFKIMCKDRKYSEAVFPILKDSYKNHHEFILDFHENNLKLFLRRDFFLYLKQNQSKENIKNLFLFYYFYHSVQYKSEYIVIPTIDLYSILDKLNNCDNNYVQEFYNLLNTFIDNCNIPKYSEMYFNKYDLKLGEGLFVKSNKEIFSGYSEIEQKLDHYILFPQVTRLNIKNDIIPEILSIIFLSEKEKDLKITAKVITIDKAELFLESKDNWKSLRYVMKDILRDKLLEYFLSYQTDAENYSQMDRIEANKILPRNQVQKLPEFFYRLLDDPVIVQNRENYKNHIMKILKTVL